MLNIIKVHHFDISRVKRALKMLGSDKSPTLPCFCITDSPETQQCEYSHLIERDFRNPCLLFIPQDKEISWCSVCNESAAVAASHYPLSSFDILLSSSLPSTHPSSTRCNHPSENAAPSESLRSASLH